MAVIWPQRPGYAVSLPGDPDDEDTVDLAEGVEREDIEREEEEMI